MCYLMCTVKFATWSLDDNCTANGPMVHSPEFLDPKTLHFPADCLLPHHNDIVSVEVDKILDAGASTRLLLPGLFPVIIVMNKDGMFRFFVWCCALHAVMKPDR